MAADRSDHLARLFQERVARYGEKTALRYPLGGRWHDLSWKSFGERIVATAKALVELGVQEGDRVGIYSANRPEWTIADLAAMHIRAVPVPIYATSTAEQAQYILDEAEIKVLFVGGRAQYERARALRADDRPRRTLIVFDPAVPLQPSEGALRWHELLALGRRATCDDEVARRLARARPDDLATLIYTSGTTGAPKGVMLDHANLTGLLAPHDLRVLDPNEHDRSLCFLPLSHVYERCWTFYALSRGMINHYLEDPAQVIEAAQQIRPTIMCAVPRLYEKIYATVKKQAEAASWPRRRLFHWAIRVGAEHARHRREARPVPASLRLAHLLADALVLRKIRDVLGGRTKFLPCAGAALSTEIEDFFLAAGLFLCQGYGLTETSATVTCNEARHFKPGTVGRPLPGTEVKIGPDDEVLVRGPGVMRGYYKKPKETAAVFVEGWLRTGDAGTIDEEGYLTITDRIKDLMKTSGGKYVAPQLLESLLGSDPFVEQAAVIGDQRKFVSALIVPAFGVLTEWARSRGIPFSSRAELLRRSEVHRLYQERTDLHNARLAGYEQIKRFTLLDTEFSVDKGEITPTMKTRRKQVLSDYHDAIEEMYAGTT